MYRGKNPSRNSVGHFDPLKMTDEIKKSMGQNDPLIFWDHLLVFANRQKEGFSHQLRSKSETVVEGIALGDAVHLVHTILKLFECLLRPLSIRGILSRERTVQLFAIPGYQL